MKKLLSILITLCLMTSAIPVCANSIDVHLNSVSVIAAGQLVNAPNILWNGSTYIPLRAVTEQLGCWVDWNGSTRTATITNDAASVATDLAKLQTQLLSIKDELWAASQIEREFSDYFDAVAYNYKGVYAAGDEIMNDYSLSDHYKYFATVGTGKNKEMYITYIDDETISQVLSYINYDPNKYHFILYQSMMYCESMQNAFDALDMAVTTGASMYIDQADQFMGDANNYWNSAADELSNLKWAIYEYLTE